MDEKVEERPKDIQKPPLRGRKRKREEYRIANLLEKHGGKLPVEHFQAYYKEKFGFGTLCEFDISYFDSFENLVKIESNTAGRAEVHLVAKRPKIEGEEVVEQIALNNLKINEIQASAPTETRDQFFERIKGNVVKLLGEHGGTLPLDQFKPFYQIRFGEVFDIGKAGIPGSKKLGKVLQRDLVDIVRVDPKKKTVYLFTGCDPRVTNLSSSIDTPLNIDTLKQRTVQILEKNGEIDVSRFRSLYSEIFNEKFDFRNFEGLRHLDKLSKFFAHYCKDIIDVVRTGNFNGVFNIRLKNEQTNEELEPSTSSQAKLFPSDSSEQQVSSTSKTTTSSASQQQKPSSVNSTNVLPTVHQDRQSSLEQQNPRSRKKVQKGPALSGVSEEQKQSQFPTLQQKQPTETLQSKMSAEFNDNARKMARIQKLNDQKKKKGKKGATLVSPPQVQGGVTPLVSVETKKHRPEILDDVAQFLQQNQMSAPVQVKPMNSFASPVAPSIRRPSKPPMDLPAIMVDLRTIMAEQEQEEKAKQSTKVKKSLSSGRHEAKESSRVTRASPNTKQPARTQMSQADSSGPYVDLENDSVTYERNGRNPVFEFPVEPSGRAGHLPNLATINERVNEIRSSICKQDRAVEVLEVVKKLCEFFKVKTVRNLKCYEKPNGFWREGEIPAVNDLLRTVCKVNCFIQSYVMAYTVSTLHEIEMGISKLMEKQSFNELKLGPLRKQPLIYEHFKFPPDNEEIPKLTTADVLEALWQYMKTAQKGKKVDVNDFMVHLAKKRGLETPYEIGIRINSIALAITTVRKAKFGSMDIRKEVEQKLVQQLKEDFESHLRKLRSGLTGKNPRALPGQENLVQKIAGMPVENALWDIFQFTAKFRRQMGYNFSVQGLLIFSERIMEFLQYIRGNTLLTKLFHVVVATGTFRQLEKDDAEVLNLLGFQNVVTKMIEARLQEEPSLLDSSGKSSGRTEERRHFVREGIVLESCRKWTENCDPPVDLEYLQRLEEKVARECHPEARDFESLGQGSFIKFLNRHREIAKALGNMILIDGQVAKEKVGTGISMEDVYEFIIQCGLNKPQGRLTESVCLQFGLDDISNLSKGSFEAILKTADAKSKKSLSEKAIIYQQALLCGADDVSETFANDSDSSFHIDSLGDTTDQGCGILGSVSKRDAILCLSSAPLLEDLSSWTNWNTVFKPSFGDLKIFLKHHLNDNSAEYDHTKVYAMETETGALLRVNMESTAEDIQSALRAYDPIETAGHLVSMICVSGNVQEAPLALLANYVQVELLNYVAQEEPLNSVQGVSRKEREESCARFILECLVRIPVSMCAGIAPKANQKLQWIPFGSRDKGHCRFPFKVKKEGEKLACCCNFALNFMVMHQEEATKDRRWLQIFLTPLNFVCGSSEMPSLVLNACRTEAERSHLHSIGIALSVADWIDDFRSRKMTVKQKKVTVKEKEINVPEIKRKVEQIDKIEEIATDNGQDQLLEPEKISEIGKHDTKENDAKPEIEETMDAFITVDSISGSDSENEIDEEDENVSENDKENETDEYCRNLIDEIRREQFGIGESFGERETKLIQIHHDRLGRSLDRLSKELYTKDTHFVLELIQNADDNTYPDEMFTDDGDDKPTVAFIINEGKVVVLNNETGFEERNIKAICDVGKSTKGVHRKGYIGQKGIGFKSVFRVTDSPEVHSNGFHIKFNASQGSIGYILPEWCESEDISADLSEGILQTDDIKQDWTTQILLPLKEKILESSSNLSARFHDIHPSLLLFLNRLKCIVIDDKINEKQLVMRKRQLKNNTVELSLNGRPSLWYVISKEIDISVRPDVSSTELSLAFQMDDAAQISLKPKPLPVQSVFAFLPLRSYGFKFLIQADFEVPSSREDIDRDSSWNQWILERIPNLVVEAFYSFKDLSTFPPIVAASKFFQFMPLEKEIHGVFKPIARKIIKLLQAESCIPVQDFNFSEDENDPLHLLSECTWMMPSSVVLSDHAISEVIPPSLLEKHLNLHYMHRGMQSAVNADLLCALGVKRITLDNLLDICKAQIKSAMSRRDEGIIEDYEKCIAWLGEWLYGMARHLEQNHDCSKETLNKIASAAIFPLSDGSVVSLHGNSIFFPVSMASTSQRQQASRYAALQEDLSTLHWHIFSNLDDIARLRVKQLLTDLGVKEMTPTDVVHNHILPIFRSDLWKNKAAILRICYLAYIEEHWTTNENIIDLSILKEHVILETNKGPILPQKQAVYFPPIYGNPIDLHSEFPAAKWTFVHPGYLRSTHPTEIHAWQKFLKALGVNHFLDVRTRTLTVHKSKLHEYPWGPYASTWPTTEDDTYIIEDQACIELELLMNSGDHIQLLKLAQEIDRQWDSHFSQFNLTKDSIPVKNKKGDIIKTTLSSVLISMKTHAWLPGNLNGEARLYVPRDLFLNLKEIHLLLSRFCSYFFGTLKNAELIDILGIKKKVEVQALLQEIQKWSTSQNFQTSLNHMRNVYDFLQKSQFSLEMLEGTDKCIVFLPRIESRTDLDAMVNEAELEGVFLSKDKVCWNDPTYSFVKYHHLVADSRPIIKNHYEVLERFFVDILKVDQTPNAREYIGLACAIADTIHLPDAKAVKKLLSVFSILGEKCLVQSERERFGSALRIKEPSAIYDQLHEALEPVMSKFVHSNVTGEMAVPLFPTVSDKFVSVEERPLLVDNKELQNIYGKSDQVHFIQLLKLQSFFLGEETSRKRSEWKEQSALLGVLLFCKVCGIQKLSSCVNPPEITPEGTEKGCLVWNNFFSSILPYIQRYMYHKDSDIYEELLKDKLPDALENIEFCLVHRLDAVYTMKGNSNVRIPVVKKCAIERLESKIYFYILSSCVDEREDIIAEFVRIFANSNVKLAEQLEMLVLSMFSLREREREKLIRVDQLPSDEKQWKIPEPKLQRMRSVKAAEKQEEATGTAKDDGEARVTSWPPKSKTNQILDGKPQARTGDTDKPVTMWPPPAPPEPPVKVSIPLNENQGAIPMLLDEKLRIADSQQLHQGELLQRQPSLRSEIQHKENGDNVVNQGELIQRQPSLNNEIQHKGNAGIVVKQNGIQLESEKDLANEGKCHQRSVRNIDGVAEKASPVKDVIVTDNSTPKGTLDNREEPISLESAYEDLSVDINEIVKEVKHLIVRINPENESEVGKIGEMVVYHHLCNLYSEEIGSGDVEITWLNESEEASQPYDIKMSRIRDNPVKPEVFYIEVKATSTTEAKGFEISSQQLRFAFKQEEKFHLYRVYGVGRHTLPSIKRLQGLSTYLDRKTVKVYVVL